MENTLSTGNLDRLRLAAPPGSRARADAGGPAGAPRDTVSLEAGAQEPSPSRWRAAVAASLALAGVVGGAVAARAPRPAPALSRVVETQRQLATRAALQAVPAAGLFGEGGVIFQDTAGRITHLALQYGNVEFDKPLPEVTRKALLGVYSTLVQNMSPDTRFTIVAADARGVQELRQMVADSGIANPERVTILDARSQKGMSIWIRDSMIPVQDRDGTTKILIQDRTYWPGPEDNRVAPMIDAAHEQITSAPHQSLRIDGGNLVNGLRVSVIGEDSDQHTRERLQELARNPAHLQEIVSFYEQRTGLEVVPEGPAGPGQATMEQMWREVPREVFESEFQREIILIGNDDPATPVQEDQPVFHIDMAVTPIGEGKFLVGDPGMAIRELQKLSPAERARVNREMAAEAGLDPSADLVGKLIEVNGGAEHQANFDNVARELQARGYEVERLPCLIGLRTTWSLPYLTYNNSIQENYRDADGRMVHKVYLPVYGCEPLDRIARETYERLGYQVVPLHMAAISILEGAIRCTSYTLERTEVPPPRDATPAAARPPAAAPR